MTPEQLKQLGLPADATPAQITAKLAELAALHAEVGTLTSTLEEVTATAEAATGALSELRTQQQTEAADRTSAEVARLKASALKRGLWETGSDRENHFDKLAAVNVELASDYVELLTPQNPIGQTSQLAAVVTMAATQVATSFSTVLSADYTHVETELHSVYSHAFAQLAITEDMLRDFGPTAIERKQKLHQDDWSASMRRKAA